MKDTLTPKLLDLMRKFEQQSIGFSAMMGEATVFLPSQLRSGEEATYVRGGTYLTIQNHNGEFSSNTHAPDPDDEDYGKPGSLWDVEPVETLDLEIGRGGWRLLQKRIFEAEKPVPPKKPLPKPEPKKADPKAEKPDFKKEKNPSTKDPKKPEPEAPAPEPREIDMKDIPKTEATKAEKQAYRQERLTRLKDNQNILKTGVCPRCGTKLVRNNSMTGWWQCGHVGSPGFQAVPGPPCDFQFFYDPSPEEAAALREATTLNPAVTQRKEEPATGLNYSFGTIPEEDASSVGGNSPEDDKSGPGHLLTFDDLRFRAKEGRMDKLTTKLNEFMDFGGVTHILKNPTGTFSPVGSVPLGMMRQSVPTADDAMGGRVRNGVAYNTRGFPSVEDFLAAAASSGTKLCDLPGCACRKYF